MRSLPLGLLAAACCLAQTVDPVRGALLVADGGKLGPAARGHRWWCSHSAGGRPHSSLKNLVPLHTCDRTLADRENFVAPLRTAHGVWFERGRQWRLVDAYLGTRTERELFALLERSGGIGGSSAGATIQGSYLVRGAREGNAVMMAPGYEQGMGFLRNVAIDQQLLARKRQEDMVAVVRAHPQLLGIGIDEGTAIVVHGDRFDLMARRQAP